MHAVAVAGAVAGVGPEELGAVPAPVRLALEAGHVAAPVCMCVSCRVRKVVWRHEVMGLHRMRREKVCRGRGDTSMSAYD